MNSERPSGPTSAWGIRASTSLLSTAGTVWLASACSLATSIVRGKASAEFLGPSGMGLTAQLTTLSLMLGGLASLGLSTAGIQLIAKARGREDSVAVVRLSRFVLIAPTATSAALCVLAAIFVGPLGLIYLGSNHHTPYLLLAIASVPLNILIGGITVICQAHGMAHRVAIANILSSIANAAVILALVSTLGLTGGAIGVLATSGVMLLIYWLREPVAVRFAWTKAHLPTAEELRTVGVIAGASFALGIAGLLSDSLVRGAVVHVLGLRENGLYQPVSMASTQGFAQISNGVVIFLLPSLAALIAASKAQNAAMLIDRAFRLTTLIVTTGALTVICLARPIITILFSADFLQSSGVLATQSVFEVVRAVAYVLGAVLLPLGRTRLWLGVGFATVLGQLLLSLVLLPMLALYALPVAFGASWLLHVAVILYALRDTSLLPSRRTFLRAVVGLGLGGMALLLHPAKFVGQGLILVAILILWLSIGMNAADRKTAGLRLSAATARLKERR